MAMGFFLVAQVRRNFNCFLSSGEPRKNRESPEGPRKSPDELLWFSAKFCRPEELRKNLGEPRTNADEPGKSEEEPMKNPGRIQKRPGRTPKSAGRLAGWLAC
jgi:hypothetical protein